jgi:hypothetical protein
LMIKTLCLDWQESNPAKDSVLADPTLETIQISGPRLCVVGWRNRSKTVVNTLSDLNTFRKPDTILTC